ncbi:MAG: hypothetical protein A2X08_14550 [Bacteroidetes bacterium GWA2_32_17]|nr:MAG: hypothetical protein A2X08_14550 [Bacteroidetes bacterium GWA2_32_17]
MKKTIFTFFLSIGILTVLAQDTTMKSKVYRNEFGIDATGFVKQFLNVNQSEFSNYYSPTYYLTYRRHFKCGNLRFAIGGAIESQDLAPAFTGDSNKYHRNSYSIDTRLGWEFSNDLSKRWQVFYGLDFRPSYSYSKNDAPYWNGGYANGSESKSQIYAVAPLLGFRIKINNRLSLSTETSLSFNFSQSSSRRYYIPVTSQYPPIPDVVTPKTKSFYSSFSQPVFIILTFDI